MGAVIRPAVPADASRLAEIQIFAKRTAFRSVFQNDFVSFNEMQVLDLALRFRDDPDMRKDVFVWDDGISSAVYKSPLALTPPQAAAAPPPGGQTSPLRNHRQRCSSW